MDANQICQQAHDDFLRHLGNNDHQGMRDMLMWLRSLLDDQRTNTMSRTGSSRQSSDEQRGMQDAICSDNLLAGITSILVGDDEHSLKQQGCSVLATLAWSNPRSSSRVATWPGILDAIANIISDPRQEMAISQEQASLVLGNCSANSKVAAETFAGHTGILDGLHSIIMRGQSKSAGAQTRETETAVLAIKNAAATSKEAAYVMTQHENLLQAIKSLATGSVESTRNMAIGAINAFSRSQDAVPILIRANILMDVFLPIMRPKSTENDTSDEAMQRLLMTATSATFNMTSEATSKHDEMNEICADWLASDLGVSAVGNLLRCLSLSLGDCRWEAVTFSPFSVLLPLCNTLKCCPSFSSELLRSSFMDNVLELFSRFREFPHSVETLQLCVSVASLISDLQGEDCMRILRSNSVMGILRDIISEIRAGTFLESMDEEERCAPAHAVERLAMDAQDLIDKLADAPITFCTSLVTERCKANPSSPDCIVRVLDRDTVDLICHYAFYSMDCEPA